MKPKADVTPVVEMRNIKKSFAAVQALRGVDLVLHQNEVLGLVGDNAAGKSTLMKILSGAYIPDEGEIFIEGKKVHYSDPLRLSSGVCNRGSVSAELLSNRNWHCIL